MYSFLFKKGNTVNELVYFDIDELRRLYFGKLIINVTNNLTFDEFVLYVIENRINLGCDVFGECFLIDNTISEEYLKIGFSKFKEKYTLDIFANDVILLNINNLTRAEILTIIYFFYLNNYFTNWSDYEGYYLSKNILENEIFQRDKGYIELEEFDS